jgi:hypothetical protein
MRETIGWVRMIVRTQTLVQLMALKADVRAKSGVLGLIYIAIGPLSRAPDWPISRLTLWKRARGSVVVTL